MIPTRNARDMTLDSLRADFARLTAEAKAGSGHIDETAWALFATDELPVAERERLIDHVLACTECAEMCRVVAHVRDGAAAFDRGAPRPRTPSGWPRWSYAGLALAASLLLAIGVATVLRSGGPVEHAEPNPAVAPSPLRTVPPAPPAPPAPYEPRRWALGGEAPVVKLPASAMGLSVRGARAKRDEFLSAFGAAIAPYRQGRYREAARALAPLATEHPDVLEISFYLGVSRLLSGDAPGAVVPLRAARDSTVSSDEAQWYEAVALERSGRPQDADLVLRGLCESRGSYQKAACDILRVSP